MENFLTREHFQAAADYVRAHTRHQPRVGLVLGSGLGDLADAVEDADVLQCTDIPHWPQSTVLGHAGRVLIGKLEGVPVLVQQGRAHFYEGHDLQHVTLPIRVMQLLGMEAVILTNAAGAIHPEYVPGDVMLITDHINFMGMAGFSPLRGPNDPTLGPRFPDMSRTYDRELGDFARQAARESGFTLHEGVYIGLSGPTFESPADLRFLRSAGADAVGMSTVPEAVVAHHGGVRVLGFSGISNKANLDGSTITTHQEVLDAGKLITPRLTALVRGVLRRL
ncbi:MAG TPA: purine-nucleoside phosphorylase [Anaerolineales bacterium]|nr:purine-nucleoside phosphorylase [Anaerolineales bacterium]HRF47802.1 purine-nucleoside phosphorylase [Anaerolineales bacterium]